MDGESVRVTLVGLPPTDNATRGMNKFDKGREVALWRRSARMSMPRADAPFAAARLKIEFGFKQNRRQGIDAYIGACKPIVDAFVDQGYLADDGWTILREVHSTAHRSMENMVVLTLTEIVDDIADR